MNTNTTQKTLADCLAEPEAFVPGRLETTSEDSFDAAHVLEKFLSFAGEGWLQIAEEEEMRVFSPDSPLKEPKGWPVAGEAASSDKSISLVREGSGWKLITTEKLPAETTDDLISTTEFRRRDAEGSLRYETCWKAVDVFGQTEIRPVAYRFAGFSSGKKEDRA